MNSSVSSCLVQPMAVVRVIQEVLAWMILFPPSIKRHNGSNTEGERACTGILLNFRISGAYCSPHILAGSILSRLIGQTVKDRLQKKSEVAIQGRRFVSIWMVNVLPHSSSQRWPHTVGYVLQLKMRWSGMFAVSCECYSVSCWLMVDVRIETPH